MSAAVWWPLFPLLFLIVLAALLTAMIRLARSGKGTRKAWLGLSLALVFYFLTFALGRWRWLHMPLSNIAELFMVYNAYHFFKVRQKDLAWCNIVALFAIAIDFALHYILK
ncbi:MAG: hypothetical protein ACE5GK_08755 [Nitrospiria bacterium]